MLAADRARQFKICWRECPHSFTCAFQCVEKFGKSLAPACAGLHLRFHRGDLLRAQRPPFSIGEQAIQAACDMPQLKRNRGKSIRPRVQLFFRQFATPAFQVFSRQLERMKNGTLHSWNVGQCSPQPWLWKVLRRHGFSIVNHRCPVLVSSRNVICLRRAATVGAISCGSSLSRAGNNAGRGRGVLRLRHEPDRHTPPSAK